MNPKKAIILKVIILCILISFINYGGVNMFFKKTQISFSELLEYVYLDKLNLTIYYASILNTSPFPFSVDHLISLNSTQKFVIDSDALKEHIDLLKQIGEQIDNNVLIPTNEKSRMDARLYYVFKTKNNKSSFRVVALIGNNVMLVNDQEVKANNILIELIMPFLPESVAKELQPILKRS